MKITQVHPHFGAEITGLSLNADVPESVITELKDALAEYGVVVIRDQQALSDDEQIEFCRRFGTLQKSITLHRKDTVRRLTRDELTDLSNIDENGLRMDPNDTRRSLQKPGQLWHSDNSFRSPPGLYTFLKAKIVPPEGGDTEFADMRAAYDALDEATRQKVTGLEVRHSLAWSREQAGSPPLSPTEQANIPESVQPLVRVHPKTGRKSLYLSSHGRDVLGMSDADGRALLQELNAFSTQPQFVYRHKWRDGDFVVWDNRSTMHRATPFPEDKYQRDMRRTSIEDNEVAIAAEPVGAA
ncbi:MAG: TauD/TfdA family dioxygenase [Alphaproteobacteria bacterium]|nr:TauD/TfdA family dioxygenase [Alphaproteobacteria bacterium]